MNREEAARMLMEFADAYCKHELTKETPCIPALRMGAAALRGPVPDPETGLVPCGCGGKAMLMTIEGCVVGAVCGSCGVGTQADENAVMVWNTAMGYKYCAEISPVPGKRVLKMLMEGK